MKRILFVVLLAAIAVSAFAQPVPTAQQPTRPDACSTANATSSLVNTTATVTLTPQNGQSVYVCGIDIEISNDATGLVVHTNATFTSTNFGGWLWKFSSPNVANTTVTQMFQFVNPVKAPATGPVTFVSPAINAHAMYNINVYYYYAP
jgi:hypothetical protein